MGWHGRLNLRYRRDAERTLVHDRHEGPLRILQSLYPEGPRVCHNVLLHPPGGIVGGDALEIELALDAGAHALLTTPGATRFYRSAGRQARQSVVARLAPDARLEWLPLETICHRSTHADNRLHFELAPGAEMIGWDVLALGLPASGEAFDHGRIAQEIEVPGAWLERGVVDGGDTLLLDSPLGFAGHRVLGTLWFAAGDTLAGTRREALLDAARAAAHQCDLRDTAGCTAPGERVVVLRVLARRVEPAMQLLGAVWARWRESAWGLTAHVPRVWRT